MMRTTINLPNDIYASARCVAHAKDVSLGETLTELVQKELQPHSPYDHRPLLFYLPGLPSITLEQTHAAEDEP